MFEIERMKNRLQNNVSGAGSVAFICSRALSARFPHVFPSRRVYLFCLLVLMGASFYSCFATPGAIFPQSATRITSPYANFNAFILWN